MRYVDGKIIGKNGPGKALVYSSQEWANLHGKINEGQLIQERNERQIMREERKKEQSKKMTSTWSNTVANLQKNRERLILDAREKAEREKLQEYNDIMAKRVEEKERMLENARKLVLQRTESSRTLDSGLVLSEVLYERDKQVEIRKKQRELLKEKELAETARKLKLAEEFRREEFQEKINHLESLQHYRHDLDEQMIDVNAEREKQEEEKLREKEDLEDLAKELAEERETKIIEANKRKKKLQEEERKWKEIQRENMRKIQQEVKEQTEMNKIFQSVRERLNKGREDLEKKLRRDAIEQREKFAFSHAVPKIDYVKEEEILARAVKEADARLKREDELKARKKEILREELQEYKKEAAEQAVVALKEREELQRWEILKRLAIEEATEKYNQQMHIKKTKRQHIYRNILLEQWEEREERERREKQDSMTAFEEERKQEETMILKLCEEVEKSCAASGRPMYPVLSAIKRVKKQNAIGEEEKTVPFLQSRVPIASVAVYENSHKNIHPL